VVLVLDLDERLYGNMLSTASSRVATAGSADSSPAKRSQRLSPSTS
jgi:hypothetical protein